MTHRPGQYGAPDDAPPADGIARFAWGDTALGPTAAWPASLKGAVDLARCLPSPAAVLWGADLVLVPAPRFAAVARGTTARPGAACAAEWPAQWPGGGAVWRLVREGRTITDARADGPAFCFSPLRDEGGAVAGILVVSLAPIAADPQATRELVHQNRNALAWVRSVVRRTAELSVDPDEFLMHLDGRLDAFARVRAAVAGGPGGVDLYGLVASELLAVAAREDRRVQIDGPEVLLPPRAVETFALAVHELATNSVKFGALGGEAGMLDIHWTVAGAALTFVWREHGLVATPTIARRGFGLEVLDQALVYELGAATEVCTDPNELRVTVTLDLARLGPPPDEG